MSIDLPGNKRMKSSGMRSALKYEVITGYALVVVIMIIGLLAVYRNLSGFRDKAQTRSVELLIVET